MPTARSVLPRLALFVLTLTAACAPKHLLVGRGPLVPALALEDATFRVVYAGPRAEVDEPLVTLAFSHPVASEEAPADVRRIDDDSVVRGTWQWFGQTTAIFHPTAPLPRASTFRVTPRTVHSALDASTVEAPPFTFSTTRPRLISAELRNEKDRIISVTADQPLVSSSLPAGLRLVGKNPKGELVTIPFTVVTDEREGTSSLRAAASITDLDDVKILTTSALRSVEGSLPASEGEIPVERAGPFRATIDCGEPHGGTTVTCDPYSWINVSFSRTVRGKDLARHLIIQPPIEPSVRRGIESESETTYFSLRELPAGSRHRVVIRAGLTATTGERLERDQSFEVRVADESPSFSFHDLPTRAATGAVVVEARRPTPMTLGVTLVNVKDLTVTTTPLNEANLADLLFTQDKPSLRTDSDEDLPKVEERTRGVDWLAALPSTRTENLAASGQKNTPLASTIALPLPQGARGAFALGARARALSGANPLDLVRVLSFTDLGLTMKWSPHSGGLVWVTRLSDAQPVGGATVSLRRVWPEAGRDGSAVMREAFSTETDRDGVARIPPQVAATFLRANDDDITSAKTLTSARPLLFVKHGEDWTFAQPPELDARLLSSPGVVFVDRGIYRPGESAFVKGYFRTPSPLGLRAPVGKTAYVEAVDETGRVFFAKTVPINAFGAFSTEVPIAATSRLGFASVRARLGVAPPPRLERSRSVDHTWPARDRFIIDAYRTVELKADIATDKTSYVRGETARVSANATYLIGAPVTNVPAKITLERAPTTYTPPGLEGYSTVVRAPEPGTLTLPDSNRFSHYDVRFDSRGRASASIPLPAALTPATPERLAIDVGVTDITQSFMVGADTSAILHPAELYVGIRARPAGRADFVFVEGDRPIVDVAAAAIHGERRAGVVTRVEARREKTDAVAATCTITTNETGDGTCTMSPLSKGSYDVRATTADSAGRIAAASTPITVMSKATAPPPPKDEPRVVEAPHPPPTFRIRSFQERCLDPDPRDDLPHPITLDDRSFVDRRTVDVGQVVNLCVHDTTTGEKRGLLTIEREGVLSYKLVDVSRRGRFEPLTIAPSFFPNIDVNVHEVVSRTGGFPSPKAADSHHPYAIEGGVGLHVRSGETAITIGIDVPKAARPGEEIALGLKTAIGGRPARAEVTVWAVDEGVDVLAPKRLPTPGETFDDPRRPDVNTLDSRDDLFFERGGGHTVKSPSIRQGATQTSAPRSMGRSIFKPTAFFIANAVTDASGRSVQKVRLPDNVTTWKIFAVAATTGEAFGSAATELVTNQPLMLRPALPRLLRAGDSLDGVVVIDSLDKRPIDVDVTARTSGVLSTTATRQHLTIPPEGHVPVRFKIDAPRVGMGGLTFRVVSARSHDEVVLPLEVQPLTTIETARVSGEIPKSAGGSITKVPLRVPEGIRADVGGFDYRLATTPLVGLAESVRDLVEYPYGCTEQLSSRLLPLIRLRGMAREVGASLPPNIDEVISSSIEALLTHQSPDGGFGFWADSKSEPWLTILALKTLYSAAERGYLVPPRTIDRARAWLERPIAAAAPQGQGRSLDPAERAMLEDLLATVGHPRADELHKLALAPSLPLFGKALVARGLAKSPRAEDAAAARLLLDDITARASSTAATATFADEPSLDARAYLSSSARTTAMVLRALLAVDPHHPLTQRTIAGLLSLRREGRWRTTQETAWALEALDEARALFTPAPARTKATFWDGDREVASATFFGVASGESLTGSIPMSHIARDPSRSLGLGSDGVRPLFYEGTLRFARVSPPVTPLERGITIARTFRPRYSAGSSVIHVGDYVIADVVVATSAARDLVVVDDPIPAGFEVVHDSLANVDRQLPDAPDPSRALVTHRERRDDRVVTFLDEVPAGAHVTRYLLRAIAKGRFGVPPAKAECMYAPDVYGRTATTWIEIQ